MPAEMVEYIEETRGLFEYLAPVYEGSRAVETGEVVLYAADMSSEDETGQVTSPLNTAVTELDSYLNLQLEAYSRALQATQSLQAPQAPINDATPVKIEENPENQAGKNEKYGTDIGGRFYSAKTCLQRALLQTEMDKGNALREYLSWRSSSEEEIKAREEEIKALLRNNFDNVQILLNLRLIICVTTSLLSGSRALGTCGVKYCV